MNSFNILKDNKQIISFLYLFLSILGAVLPMMANFEFAKAYGDSFDINNFIALANVNPAGFTFAKAMKLLISKLSPYALANSKFAIIGRTAPKIDRKR